LRFIDPTRALAFVLAFLAQAHQRSAYDSFWRAATEAKRGGEDESKE
jgi:hypothetical protein